MSHRKLPFGFRSVPQILNLEGTSLDRRGGYKGGYAHRAFPNRCFRATALKLRVLRETSGPATVTPSIVHFSQRLSSDVMRDGHSHKY